MICTVRKILLIRESWLRSRIKHQRAESGVVLQVNLLGAIVFSVALVFAAGNGDLRHGEKQRHVHYPLLRHRRHLTGNGPEPAEVPPWGELFVRDIKIKPPEEYLAFELQHITPAGVDISTGHSIDASPSIDALVVV